MSRLCVISITGVALTLGVRAAWALPAPNDGIGLVYTREQGTATCPDRALFRRLLVGVMGRDPVTDTVDPLLTVALSRERGNVRGVVTLKRGGAVVDIVEREAPLAECQDLVDSLALSTKLLLTEPPPARSDATVVVPSAPLPLPKAATPPTPPPRTRAWTAHAGANLSAAWWGFPAPVFSVGASLGARWRVVSLTLEGRYFLPASARFYDVQAFGASLVPCIHYGALFGCADWTLAYTLVHARQRVEPATLSTLGPRVGVEMALAGRWALRLHAGVAGRLVPYLGGVDRRVQQASSPWTFAAGAGVVAHF